MRELRTCPVTGVTVLLHTDFPDRPLDPPEVTGECWACGDVGPVVDELDGCRAVPHPTPALGVEGDVRIRKEGVGVWRDAVGAHELLIGPHDSPDTPLLSLAARRITDLRGDTRLRGFALVREATPGAHTMWQLFALPTEVREFEAAALRDREISERVRVIAENDGAVALAAWAPTVPFETWVLPNADVGFPAGVEAVATLCEGVRVALHRTLGAAVTLRVEFGAPWRVVLTPRVRSTVPTASFGLPGHGVWPERAARVLRGG